LNNRRGFTLIEMLTAFALLICISMGLNYLLKSGKSAISSASKQRQAVYAAQSKMEEIAAVPYSSLAAFNENSFADGKGRISINSVASNLMRITLEMQWSANKRPLRLSTLRSNL